MKERILNAFKDHADLVHRMAFELPDAVERAAMLIRDGFRSGRTLYICGNGGSAADAQHFAAEFVNRFRIERQPLPAVALTTDTSVLTAIGNDTGYDAVFRKQVEAYGKAGDILAVLTTSDVTFDPFGHSANLAEALRVARAKKMSTLGFVSQKSKEILSLLDLALMVPHTDTPRIQEAHITLIHIITDLVEHDLYGHFESHEGAS